MKPTPAALIDAVRDALRPLGGELTSPESRAALRRVLYVLREGRWDDAAFDLLADNEALAEAIDGMTAVLGGEGTAAAELPRSFTAANARNHALRAQLATLLDQLGERDLAESTALRTEIAVLLRRQR